MSRLLNKARKEGLSLRATFAVMLVVSFVLTGSLLFTMYKTLLAYHSMSDAIESYIETEEATDSLLRASDYLTEEARFYVVVGDRVHLDNYMTEAEETKRREDALEVMEKYLPDSEALEAFRQALRDSVSLMEREYYAMRLVLEAKQDPDIPEAIWQVRLSEEDLQRTPEEKIELARWMMHDEAYTQQKDEIRADLARCAEELKAITNAMQNETSRDAYRNLISMTILIILQSIGLILTLILTTRLGIDPLIRAVEQIKQNQRIPVIGAHEFRYLAGAYNKMFTVYNDNLDELSYKATHDELTGVYNRAGYDLIKENVNSTDTALLLFDADRFKQINDQYGHETGDKILMKVTGVLQQHFRPDDYIFRIGGDEFVVFMVHVDDTIIPLIENKVVQINRGLADDMDELPDISVSVGVSLNACERDPQRMFNEADTALYYVKEHGRNGCCFYRKEMGLVQSGT